ncbi:hypothetical protein BGZ65_006930 [Modicella reniformis]|uniref:Tubulin-specific chaperone A n=1 Tax=Modicella reniformis TaxID=1440133 RepID=A0A9P6LR84_9FUNG|nr:hypothetical protein BGZ65_006930 [Modicella reniformis]
MVERKDDEYDIKKQHEVLEETLDMLPDVERRLGTARLDLQNIVTNASDDLKLTNEYQDAVRELDSL